VRAKRPVPAIQPVEAVVAATKKSAKSAKLQTTNNALQVLTAAALMLPGLLHSTAQATEDDEFSFQYGRYQEGSRNLGDTKLSYDPITVDSLQSGGKIKLTDRIKLAFNFSQDTWAGATPITTAPTSRYGNNPVQNSTGTVVGASPYIQSMPLQTFSGTEAGPNADLIYFDQNLKPLNVAYSESDDSLVNLGQAKSIHTMVSASPEVRKEGNFKLSYEWDEAAATIGGGISGERDYESRFTNLGLRLDFDQKRTTVDFGASYTNSLSQALIMHDAISFLSQNAFINQLETTNDGKVIEGVREDWAGSLNLTQVMNKNALLKLGAGYTHSAGYLENPYKAVTAFFLSPAASVESYSVQGAPYAVDQSSIRAYMEDRPNSRNQLTVNAGWVQYIEPVNAALHLDYRYFFDDWGINAHTFDADWVQPLGAGWTVTPRVRYYSQSAADFYYPYLVAFKTRELSESNEGYDLLPNKNFTSDHRLSAYGALSGGVMLSKQLAKGIRLDAGFEYYTHKGSLNMGSGGEGDYADFNYYLVSGALNVNISQLGRSLTESDHAHHRHMHHHGAPLPAGVMFGHMMPSADDVMVGYRYMYGRQDGDMLHGSNKSLGDADIVAGGCLPETCRTAPTYMDMHMHMLDIMYAPTDWLNLMLMPQFMDMNMNLRGLSGVSPPADASSLDDHLTHGGHTTGGIADTSAYALFKLFGDKSHHVNLALGVSAPTGDSGITLNRWHTTDGGYIHYGMQLGSGTWDFKPSLTYTGHHEDWGWGAQVTSTTRLESANKYGYALGDIFQTSAWGSYNVLDWLSASVRGIYTTQGKVKGMFNSLPGSCATNHAIPTYDCPDVNPKHGVMDNPANYGGQYWDVGLGLNASVMDGAYAGHQFGVEWLQPVMENVNGYQLERFGTLNATWTYMF
jgi:hypothetical protein